MTRCCFLLLFSFLFFSSLAQSRTLLLNDREGEKSSLISKYQSKKLKAIEYSKVELSESIISYFNQLKINSVCSINVTEDLLKLKNEKLHLEHIDSKTFLQLIRQDQLIDDQVYLALEKSRKFILGKSDNQDLIADLKESEDLELTHFVKFRERMSNGRCLVDNIKQLANDLTPKKVKKKFNSKKAILKNLKKVRQNSILSDDQVGTIKRALKYDLHLIPLSLIEYGQKKQSLRAQYPLPRLEEYSDFVTTKFKKKPKISYRRKLVENFNYFQIILMGNVIKKLKERMDSNQIDILVYKRDGDLLETISLDPMERYRFAVKILQKEMKELANNTYFGGVSPQYTDLITAAYEIGIVTADEVDEVALIEEIWNPKQTFFEKSWVWVKMFGNVATLLIPQPFGFIPALAIVAIEAATKKPVKDEGHTLF